jgi:hypothetical protein
VGIYEERDKASDLLSRERVLLSKRKWPSEERERVVSEGEDRDARNNNASLRCEKKGDPGWQSKEASLKKRVYPIGSP